MDIIKVDRLKKYFRVPQKKPGIFGLVSSLVKPEYSLAKAVDDIEFSIKEGELVGFIGPNGAGKTTTLKILSGILYPDSGEVSVSGHVPWKREEEFLKKMTLIMGQKNQLIWELPPMDTFLLNRAIYEIPKGDFNRNLSELVELLDVDSLLNTPVRRLSLGQRMRLELVAALLHRPQILFLDEPTIGLDIVAQEKVRGFVADYNKNTGSTVLLTSHYMGDIARLAQRVIIINQGKIIFDGGLSQIQRRAKDKLIKLLLTKEVDLDELKEFGEVTSFEFPHVEIKVKRVVAPQLAGEILEKFEIADLTIEEVPIEELIRGIFANGSK